MSSLLTFPAAMLPFDLGFKAIGGTGVVGGFAGQGCGGLNHQIAANGACMAKTCQTDKDEDTTHRKLPRG